MRLIAWNCKMAFRNKATDILQLSPDILVVPECENPDNLHKNPNKDLSECLWFGDNQHKGMGIFGLNGYKLSLRSEYDERFKWIVPIRITGKDEFTLLAIWACKYSADKKINYIEQVYFALRYYENILAENNTIIAGDFNSNMIWDKEHRVGNHSEVVSLLSDKGIESIYHRFFNEEQGAETQSTHYFWHRKSKPFHIDYCFASQAWVERLASVSIGEYEEWYKVSDHCPLIVDFK